MHSYRICMILRITTNYFPKKKKNEMLLVMEMQCVSSVAETGALNIIQINYGFKKSMYIQL